MIAIVPQFSISVPAIISLIAYVFNLQIRHVWSFSDSTSYKSKQTVRCYVVPSATPPPTAKPFEMSHASPNYHSAYDKSSSYILPIILMGVSGTLIIFGIMYLVGKHQVERRRRRAPVLPIVNWVNYNQSNRDTFGGIRLLDRAVSIRSRVMSTVRSPVIQRDANNNNIFTVAEEPPPSYDQLFSKSTQPRPIT